MLVAPKNLKYNQDGTGTPSVRQDVTSTSTWTMEAIILASNKPFSSKIPEALPKSATAEVPLQASWIGPSAILTTARVGIPTSSTCCC